MEVLCCGGCSGIALCAAVGALLGHMKGQPLPGLIIGGLLGPIGWCLILLASDARRKCPECLGPIERRARRCKNCGVELDWLKDKKPKKVLAPPAPPETIAIKCPVCGLRKEVASLASLRAEICDFCGEATWADAGAPPNDRDNRA